MTATNRNPSNPNFLQQNKFILNFGRAPSIQFFCQSVSVVVRSESFFAVECSLLHGESLPRRSESSSCFTASLSSQVEFSRLHGESLFAGRSRLGVSRRVPSLQVGIESLPCRSNRSSYVESSLERSPPSSWRISSSQVGIV